MGCDNGSMDSTWLPGVAYLVQIQKAELWLLQQPPPSSPVTDILGNIDSRSHQKYPYSLLMEMAGTDGCWGQNLRARTQQSLQYR